MLLYVCTIRHVRTQYIIHSLYRVFTESIRSTYNYQIPQKIMHPLTVMAQCWSDTTERTGCWSAIPGCSVEGTFPSGRPETGQLLPLYPQRQLGMWASLFVWSV
jgi:hypothetical protein